VNYIVRVAGETARLGRVCAAGLAAVGLSTTKVERGERKRTVDEVSKGD